MSTTYIHTCIHTHIHAYIHAYKHTYMHTNIHTCIQTYMSKILQYAFKTNTPIYTDTYILGRKDMINRMVYTHPVPVYTCHLCIEPYCVVVQIYIQYSICSCIYTYTPTCGDLKMF